MASNPATRVQPAQRAVQIPELDTILPYKCRAPKRQKVDPCMEFLKGVPEQYHGAILNQMAEERAVRAPTPRARSHPYASSSAGVKSEGAAVAPTAIKKDGGGDGDGDGADDNDDDDDDGDDEEESDAEDKDDLFKDDKKIKTEPAADPTEPAADPPAGAPASVYINTQGHISKTDLGPRAVLGQWRVDDDTVVPPKSPEDVAGMEARFAAAHDAHGRAERMKRPAACAHGAPMAVGKRPACAHGAPMASAVKELRRMRRLRGKQIAPQVYHTFTIPDELVREKVATLKNVASFTSWGYHKVRAAIKKGGYSDAYAKTQAAVWHRKLKDIWTHAHGGAT